MYKLLLAENRPILISGLSSIVREALMDVDVQVAKSFAEVNEMLDIDQFEMLILCLPIDGAKNKEEKEKIENSMLRFGSKALILLSENVDDIHLNKLSHYGIREILNKSANSDDVKQAIQKVYKEDAIQLVGKL